MIQEGLHIREHVAEDEDVPAPGDPPVLHTLAELVEQFGGYEGELLNPFTGQKVPVSLDRWRGKDPRLTFLEVSFVSASPPEGFRSRPG